MNTSITQCLYLLTLAEPILASLDDSHRALEPSTGVKTAGWLVGHMAVTGDFARRLCGRPPICPREWRTAFNPGTQPSTDPATYPPMELLCRTFREVYRDLCAAAAAIDAAAASAPNPYEPARAGFPTSGEFVEYMLSGHLGWHLGQLYAWRGAAGVARPDRAAAATA